MIYIFFILLVLGLIYFSSTIWTNNISKLRAASLLSADRSDSSNQDSFNLKEIDFNQKINLRIYPKNFCYIFFVFTFIISFFFSLNFIEANIRNIIFTLFASFYASLLGLTLLKKYFKEKAQRDVLLQTPLMLESLILLVESGLGIIPAMQELIKQQSNLSKQNNIPFLHLEEVYRLSSAGFTFSDAVKQVSANTDFGVLRHCLIHLDCSQSEGGKLIPSLINLANYSHSEWKLNSEAKVRRLENLVVFPVFTAVIGLMLLVSAAPLVPLFEFGKIDNKQKEIFNNRKPLDLGYVK